MSESHSEGKITGKENVGGLVGVNLVDGSVFDSYSIARVSGEKNVGGLVGYFLGEHYTPSLGGSYFNGSVSGTKNVGGIVGLSGIIIKGVYNLGTVDGNLNVGGIAGSATDIIDSYSKGTVTGKKNVGGIVGVLSDKRDKLEEVYVTGKVSGTTNVGALIGTNDGAKVSSAYWNVKTVTQSVAVGRGYSTDTSNVQGLTKAEMTGKAAKNNMEGFGFKTDAGTIWYYGWYVTENYPILGWQKANK